MGRHIKKNEEVIYPFVLNGCLRIDPDGKVWRTAVVGKGGTVVPVIPRRAEFSEDDSPYLKIRVQTGNIKYKCMAHRLVYRHFKGEIPDGCEVNHDDGDHRNNLPENLFATTHSDNMIHSFRVIKTSDVRGERNPRCTVSSEKVRRAKRLLSGGEKVRGVAERLGISRSIVKDIASGRRWDHVEIGERE